LWGTQLRHAGETIHHLQLQPCCCYGSWISTVGHVLDLYFRLQENR
jgi:hypothetical protein